jgi:hypothetical protein
MRGKVYGTWLVEDYFHADDHPGPTRVDPDTGENYY